MTNIEMVRDGDKLVITIDLSRDFGLSSSGKTRTIAKTGGFVPVPDSDDTIVLNLNCNKRIKRG